MSENKNKKKKRAHKTNIEKLTNILYRKIGKYFFIEKILTYMYELHMNSLMQAHKHIRDCGPEYNSGITKELGQSCFDSRLRRSYLIYFHFSNSINFSHCLFFILCDLCHCQCVYVSEWKRNCFYFIKENTSVPSINSHWEISWERSVILNVIHSKKNFFFVIYIKNIFKLCGIIINSSMSLNY